MEFSMFLISLISLISYLQSEFNCTLRVVTSGCNSDFFYKVMNINDIRDIEKPVLKRSLISIQIFYVSAACFAYAYLYLLLASTFEHSECIPGTRPEPLNHCPKTEGGVMQPLVYTTKWGACPQCLQNALAACS